jgi:hypothetical protein
VYARATTRHCFVDVVKVDEELYEVLGLRRPRLKRMISLPIERARCVQKVSTGGGGNES